MLELTRGDLLKAPVEALVNAVNASGVMGKGIALQFKKTFPDNYEAYRQACQRQKVKPGKVFVFRLQGSRGPKYILNFPTKRHWRNVAHREDITAGLNDLVIQISELGITSIAIPALGCGLGGLSWESVFPLIAQSLGGLEHVRVLVFEPDSPLQPVSASQKVP